MPPLTPEPSISAPPWPERLLAYPWLPARWAGSGAPMAAPPDLLVIHSGAVGRGVAEYLAACADGREVSAHICWSSRRDGYVQQVSLRRQAWHAGGSICQGMGHVNARSIGIELPGPASAETRSDHEAGHTRILVAMLRGFVPSLRYVTRHSDIDPGKHDPGPGFEWAWLDGLGLEWVH